MIYGNTAGVKATILERLENLTGDYGKHLFIDREVLGAICEITSKINREICVYISRNGRLLATGIGDAFSVPLKGFNLRRGETRFSGVRIIHTHPSGSGRLSELDISALRNLRLDCMAAVGVADGQPTDMEAAYIREGEPYKKYIRRALEMDDGELLGAVTEYENQLLNVPREVKEKESAILVNVSEGLGKAELDELERLAETADVEVAGKILQTRKGTDRAYCAGKGKLAEIAAAVQQTRADYVIFNNQLSGMQLKNLEEELGVSVIDRSMLILEIFAKHATSNEGKLQVELAMMKYTLPKLVGSGRELSRIGGGSGSSFTRGGGETKLEMDRRKIKRGIFELNEKIEKLKQERDLRRSVRIRSGVKTVAIVGYTNAGKSTLMNVFSRAGVLEADKLFATLDPVTRKIFYKLGKEYLLTDTVGFIDNLPHEFIDAFRSTLEEARYADVLLHVADASSEDLDRQQKVVKEVLASLGAGDKPMITAYNKVDLVPQFTLEEGNNGVAISAKTGKGVAELKKLIEETLFGKDTDGEDEKNG